MFVIRDLNNNVIKYKTGPLTMLEINKDIKNDINRSFNQYFEYNFENSLPPKTKLSISILDIECCFVVNVLRNEFNQISKVDNIIQVN